MGNEREKGEGSERLEAFLGLVWNSRKRSVSIVWISSKVFTSTCGLTTASTLLSYGRSRRRRRRSQEEQEQEEEEKEELG